MLQSQQQKKQDQLALVYLMKVLKECKMIKQFNISMLTVTIIGQFSLGYIASCECRTGEVLILPSMKKDFQSFNCRDCKNGSCTTIKCHNCIDKENLFSLNHKKYDVTYPPIYCDRCMDDDDNNNAPICSNCSFICKGCLDFYCKQQHLKQICPTCNAQYCDKEEWEFSNCIACNRINCSFCKTVFCFYFQTWIDCSEYNGCKFCYSSNIMQYYEDSDQYKSCMRIVNNINKHLSLPIHIIQIIATFLNDIP